MTIRDRVRKFFKALSDKTRIDILNLLLEANLDVWEICDGINAQRTEPLSQPTISRHLSVLKEAGMVNDKRHGQNVAYRLTETGRRALKVVRQVEQYVEVEELEEVAV